MLPVVGIGAFSRLRPTSSSEPIYGHDVVNRQWCFCHRRSQHENAYFCFKATCGDISFSSSQFRAVSKTARKRKAPEESDVSSSCNTDDLNKEELFDALDFLEDLRDTSSAISHSLPSCDCARNECAIHLVNQSLLSVKASLARIEALAVA